MFGTYQPVCEPKCSSYLIFEYHLPDNIWMAMITMRQPIPAKMVAPNSHHKIDVAITHWIGAIHT